MSQSQLRTLRQVYQTHLQSFYDDCDLALLHAIREAIDPVAEEIASTFYRAMREDNEGRHFLSDQMVSDRLHASMTRWVRQCFVARSTENILAFIEQQLKAGHVHARINLPPHLLVHGIRLLKQAMAERLITAGVQPITTALAKMHHMMDIASALLTECYFTDVLENERHSQMLRQQLLGNDLALRCERLRADMFDWVRRLLAALHIKENVPVEQLPSARHSDFGLWITHKAGLYFPDIKDVHELGTQLQRLEKLTESARAARCEENQAELIQIIATIDKTITRISWLFSSLADHYASVDGARDALTRLYNRRFLDPVLQRETQYCMRSGTHYAILMLDLDHFKGINDRYGHAVGDRVLVHAAELMQSNIRAGDFLFRYGGEEFMIVMTDILPETVQRVSQKLLDAFNSSTIEIEGEAPISVTASIGIAIYQGNPDYASIIGAADAALYRAKQDGRNRYVLAA